MSHKNSKVLIIESNSKTSPRCQGSHVFLSAFIRDVAELASGALFASCKGDSCFLKRSLRRGHRY